MNKGLLKAAQSMLENAHNEPEAEVIVGLVRLGAIGKRDQSQNRAGGRFASHTYYFRPTPPRRVSQ